LVTLLPVPPRPVADATPAPIKVPPPATPPAVAPSSPAPLAAGPRRVIALDIGHTIAQPGAISASGVPEFEFNRRIVHRIDERLRNSPRFEPVIINPDGNPITLSERARRAALAGAALLIAVHHDSVADKYLQVQEIGGRKLTYCDRFKGFGVFMSQKNPQADRSFAFARLLGLEMQKRGFEFSPHHHEPIQGENRPIIDPACGVYQYDDLIVLKSAVMPAVLLECGVIVNREQEVLLAAPVTQQMIADAVVAAIGQYFDAPR
jgi:N-acetylmuramoyl-L-alanine amidase